MWAMQGLKKKFTDCVYIENVDEGVLTVSAFSVKVSVKRPFSEDFHFVNCFCLRGLWLAKLY